MSGTQIIRRNEDLTEVAGVASQDYWLDENHVITDIYEERAFLLVRKGQPVTRRTAETHPTIKLNAA